MEKPDCNNLLHIMHKGDSNLILEENFLVHPCSDGGLKFQLKECGDYRWPIYEPHREKTGFLHIRKQ